MTKKKKYSTKMEIFEQEDEFIKIGVEANFYEILYSGETPNKELGPASRAFIALLYKKGHRSKNELKTIHLKFQRNWREKSEDWRENILHKIKMLSETSKEVILFL